MSNKIFCLALCAMLLALSFPAEAQQAGKVSKIGYLSGGWRSSNAPLLEAFQMRLNELGYIEGKNVVIEYRWAEGKLERLPELAAELVSLNVDIIVAAGGSPVVLAASKQRRQFPLS